MRLWVDATDEHRQDDGGARGRTGDEAGREASGRLRFGAEPARFHPAAIDGVPDFAGVSEDDLSRGVETVGRQSEIVGSLGDAGQVAALHNAPEVQRPQLGVGDCRCDDPDGRAAVCEEFGGDGCDRHGDDDGERAFSKPGRADAAQMGESLDDCVVWQFAVIEFGVGLGTGQRQVPGRRIDGQSQ